jgi:hypothetical protein
VFGAKCKTHTGVGSSAWRGLCQQSDGGLISYRREYLDGKLGGEGGALSTCTDGKWMKMKGYLGRSKSRTVGGGGGGDLIGRGGITD